MDRGGEGRREESREEGWIEGEREEGGSREEGWIEGERGGGRRVERKNG